MHAGARLAVECRDRDNGTLTHNAIGVSDANGDYRLLVKGDHQKDICEVKVIKSPTTDCSEPMEGLDRARIALTGNNGLLSSDRYANPLGFMKTHPLPECTEVLKELGFFSLAN